MKSYYQRLIDAGLPEVYAVMAVRNEIWDGAHLEDDINLLSWGFSWRETKVGFDFWDAVNSDFIRHLENKK